MLRFARPRNLFILLVVLILLTTAAVVAAGNTVNTSRVGSMESSIGISNLIPSQCSGQGITTIVTVSGTRGTGNNALYLGDGNANSFNAANGTDCLLGGGGNDTLKGGNGNDILIGGPGNDNLDGGNQTDVCDGGAGTDTCSNKCETKISCEL